MITIDVTFRIVDCYELREK